MEFKKNRKKIIEIKKGNKSPNKKGGKSQNKKGKKFQIEKGFKSPNII